MTASESGAGHGSEQAGDGGRVPRVDNGLRAATYVPLTDVEAAVGQVLLTALGRARIAAYLVPSETGADVPGDQHRLYVAAEERVDARTIVAAAVRALADADGTDADEDRAVAGGVGNGGSLVAEEPDAVSSDPLAGIDTDEVFRQLVADWHVDTHIAIRQAERDLTREDADWRARLVRPPIEDPVWLDDDHYVPPPPPPLPRLAAVTIMAIVILSASIVILGFGATFGLVGNISFVLGIGGILLGAGILLSRLHDTGRDEDDDGAAI